LSAAEVYKVVDLLHSIPCTAISNGCGPEPLFWILVFVQEMHRPSVDDELLELEMLSTVSDIDKK